MICGHYRLGFVPVYLFSASDPLPKTGSKTASTVPESWQITGGKNRRRYRARQLEVIRLRRIGRHARESVCEDVNDHGAVHGTRQESRLHDRGPARTQNP